jgi:succinoglycan biosynthesis transport protein ExoP
MTATQQHTPSTGIDLNGILFIIYRHKWKILFLSIVGIAAAAYYQSTMPAVYESDAKILIKYVLDRGEGDRGSVESGASPDMQGGESVIGSEVEIMTSWDLALEVADAVGVQRLAPNAPATEARGIAAKTVSDGLTVTPLKDTSVILLTYQNEDPELTTAVLQELINRYQKKHLEVHRSLGILDAESQDADQIRSQLLQTEDALKKAKTEAGILSVEDSTTSMNATLAKDEQTLSDAQTDLAEQQATVKAMEALLSSGRQAPAKADKSPAQASPAPAPASSGDIQHYQALVERLADLRKSELELLAKYTPESELVKSTRDQITTLDNERHQMEVKTPGLVSSTPKGDSGPQLDLNVEKIKLAAIQARVDNLRAQTLAAQANVDHLADVSGKILALERQKQQQEEVSKYYDQGLQRARLDEALDPSKMPNMSIVQSPTGAVRASVNQRKILMGLAGGGIGLGLAIAFLIELLFDRSVKRPMDIEARLHMPLFLSIPYFKRQARAHLQLKNINDGDGGKAIQKSNRPTIAPWDAGHFIRPYAEAVCDRLILSFQLKNLTHKPKLVGMTGLSGGEGTSTLAASLAAELSKTGDGKVLLVDLNPDRSQAHPFFDGKPALGLSDALDANGSMAPAAENLYFAKGAAEAGGSMYLPPKKFYDLMPTLKASRFDYVIFDMPPVCRSSGTLAIAGCLDKVLLVVEAEKSDRNEIKRTFNEFVHAKADISCVLNKTKVSGPKWLVS